MRQVKSSSFEFLEPDEIEVTNVVEHLVSQSSARPLKSGGETWACAWAPDNSYFAWSSGHRILQLIPWDSEKKKRHCPNDTEGLKFRRYHVIDCAENIWSLAFGSGISQGETTSTSYKHCRFDKNLIVATGLASGRIKLWNCHAGTLIIELLDHRETVRCLDFTKTGTLQLVSASRDGTLKLWDLNNEGNMYSTFKSPPAMLHGCCFAPNGHLIAAVGNCKSVFLWEGLNLTVHPHKLEGHWNEVAGCDFSPDSSLLITASFDTKVILWDTASKQKLRTFGHLHPSPRLIFAGGANDHYVRNVSFSRNGLVFASICDDGYTRLWNIEQTGDPFTIHNAQDAVSCKFAPDGSVLAIGYRSGDVHFCTASMPVPNLLQLTRQAILKHVTGNDVDKLPLPNVLIRYLQYRDFLHDDSRID